MGLALTNVASDAPSFEHMHDFTHDDYAGDHHGADATSSPASEYLALAQPHDGDAGQATTHGGGHDQGVSDYAHMAATPRKIISRRSRLTSFSRRLAATSMERRAQTTACNRNTMTVLRPMCSP